MSGVNEIEELVDGALSILSVARKAGPSGWEIRGNTLTINDASLMAAVKSVLSKVNAVELEAEMRDLNPFEAIGLARHVLSCLPKALGGK